jgi:hypothetical protein
MKMMDLLYNIKEIESTMEVGGSGPPRRQLIIVNLKLEYLRIVAGFFMSSTSLKLVYANGIIRFAHEPFVGGLQKISNLSNFVAGFFMSSTSLKLVYANGIIRFAHEPFVGGLQRILNLRNFVAGFFMSSTSLKRAWLGFGHEKTHEKISWVFILWRRVRDSNPRTCYSQQFSRLPQSTTLPTLRAQKYFFFRYTKFFF